MTAAAGDIAQAGAGNGGPVEEGGLPGAMSMISLSRMFAIAVVAVCFVFVFNNFLIFWGGWPGLPAFFSNFSMIGFEPPRTPLGGTAVALGAVEVLLYAGAIAGTVLYVLRTLERTMHADAETLSAIVGYIARAAFWAVLLIGIVDSVISFLRVEDLLPDLIGVDMAQNIDRNTYRGAYVHFPLIAAGFIIAALTRGLAFHWLALLIVIAEFQIVILRFVFSYEQAFMADLVRMWYGALFLFASAYTLAEEGHVRVDILYAGFSKRGKARANLLGSVLLGTPLCWVILTMGMWRKSNVINGPLLSFEVTQQGFGLYVKYLLAGFLLIFAVTMLVQFMSYFLKSAAILLRAPGSEVDGASPTMAGPGSAANPEH